MAVLKELRATSGFSTLALQVIMNLNILCVSPS